IFEIQQTSDLAQNVMPSDVYGRRLSDARWEANITATLGELRSGYQPRPNHGLELRGGPNRRVFGCAGPHFALERWALAGPATAPGHPRRCSTLSNPGNPVTLDYVGGREQLGRGESCILPAALGDVLITPHGEG